MNIIYCHVFSKEENVTAILTCHSKLVSYYLSKCFVVLDHKSDGISIFPKPIKQYIHAIESHPNDFVMTQNRNIPYVDKIL